ncbi:MAG: phosphoribosylformylglycinamidine cyclo-ligase [Eggerthellales bacterium]|nr:phosphoribosylformylglycinamidine cyclo-ligase [Eggerthellales bacterium]
MAEQVTYAQAGVDIVEGARAVDAIKDAVHSTYRPEVIGDIGGFGGLFSAAALKGMEEPVLISGTDGVGTKLRVAQLIGKHDTVGVDLVAMCVNDILACGAEPLFFLDYIAIGKLRKEHVADVVGGIADGCRQAGCALVGGEMAEHPGVMDPDDYDLSGFCVGVVDRPLMIGPDLVKEGDVVLGMASSGLHSNGYSLARRVLLGEYADKVYPCQLPEELSTPCDDLGGLTVPEAMLVPTRIYVKPVLKAIKDVEGGVHAVAHITGGGITENLNRALPDNLDAQVTLGSWEIPGIVARAIEAAGLSQAEALKTFNMGVGMCVIVDAKKADQVAEILTAAGEQVSVVGKIVAGKGEVVYA